jgi:DNA-directed RNA polymerase II subunit RPB1
MNNYKDMPSSKIIGVQFSMLSPEEIRKNSVVEISSRDTYINNKQVPGGLFDSRMGVLEPGIICPTDGHTYIDTPGYFGHIELARPVFFIQHIKEIIKISKLICYKCSKLLVNKNKHQHILEYTPEKRWHYLNNVRGTFSSCGSDTDDGCGCVQPVKIRLEGFATIKASIESENDETGEKSLVETELDPDTILRQFTRISDEDVVFMGFSPIWSRPEWMVCKVLPVPPPAVRPSVKHDAQQRSEDDLTHIYSSIIKNNTDLADKIANNASANVIKQLIDTVQYLTAMIVNNKVKGTEPMAQRSGRTMNCIMSRLNSKNGRIRGNLMGKRVDFSARSVITGDPNLSIRQLGVPMKIAMNITKPVTVNDRTRDFLMTLVQRGPDEYPGAKILERKNGESITLRYVDRQSVRLHNGDIVHRHMMDGDAVLFNRQPSLHRMSMMCHIVKIMKKGDTFRMNVGDTKPYNADFDGDEMNMHMPQNELAEIELKHLAAIPYQMISPAGNAPIIGIFQDSMLGSYRFTRPSLEFDDRTAMNLLMMYKNVNPTFLQNKGKKISSFDIISQILPAMTLKYKTKLHEDDEDPETTNNILEIRNGTYIRGQMEKSVLGSTTKGIIHRICNDFGNLQASQFVDDMQNVITEYMATSSFSVGISDLIADRKTQDNIIHAITTQKQEVKTIIENVHLGTFENNTSTTNNSEFETSINNVLNKATEQAGKIGRKSLSKNNRFLMIVNSGSKGSLINISQMISCLGQTNVDGKRIPYGFDNRTLPHFSKYDDTPGARGFIENSYISGLTAPELFFHAMGGRIGLIDTAVKTSQTGYIQRRLIKGLEDIKIEYDMTVRNNMGKIIQFAYGDDGFDSTKIENQSLPLVGMSSEDIYLHYDMIGANELNKLFTKGTATRYRKQKKELENICKKHITNMLAARDDVVKNVFNDSNDNGIRMPIAFQNMIVNIQGHMNLNKNSLVDITPLECFDLIETYLDKLKKMSYVKPTPLFEIMYLYYLNPRELISKKRFHKKALILLLETIVLKYKQAIVHPGEMVGVIAGQSIGEPTTQLTLNTFHLSGVASKSNVTRGVPRIEEILRLTKNPKNPSLTVHLKAIDEHSQEKASQYANMLEHTRLKDVVKRFQICFDPTDENTNIEEDAAYMKEYNEFEKLLDDCDGQEYNNEIAKSKWIVRMEFDSETMLEKNITMDDIHFAINSSNGNNISCVYSDYNSDNLIFRIRMNSSVLNKSKKQKGVPESLDQSDDIYLLRNFQENVLNNIVLRGISGITDVMPRKLQNMVKEVDDKYIQTDMWVLDTKGTNLMEVLSFDFIDNERTFSNDIKEVFKVLGIEAARQVLYNELVEVMDFSGVYINYHHLSILCDRMTCNQNMVAIFRSGILNDNIGPLSKSTFEVHTEVLLDASRHADFDHMRGVSGNVMMGQLGTYGTGMFNVVLDIDALKNVEDISAKKRKDIETMFGTMEDDGDICSKNNIEIKNNVSAIKRREVDTYDDDDNFDIGF